MVSFGWRRTRRSAPPAAYLFLLLNTRQALKMVWLNLSINRANEASIINVFSLFITSADLAAEVMLVGWAISHGHGVKQFLIAILKLTDLVARSTGFFMRTTNRLVRNWRVGDNLWSRRFIETIDRGQQSHHNAV